MPLNNTQQDILIAEFLDSQGNKTFTITDWTSFNIERDFFTPADAFTLILQDDRAVQLNTQLQAGMAIRFSIQPPMTNKTCVIMTGYIFSYHLSYDLKGSKLTIKGQDLLGYMAKAVVYPNLGKANSNTNFHFNVTDTLQYAIQTIANAFTGETQLPDSIIIDVEDGADLTFATGFATGIKSKGKTGRGLAHSLQNNLNHLTSPNKGETYLAYISRLAKHAGCNVKMAPARNDKIIISNPTYDRSNPSPYSLFHSLQGMLAPTTSGQSQASGINNALEGSLEISLDEQPSAIIVEGATQGTNAFYRSKKKAVVVNELTGYPRLFSGQILTKDGGQSGTISPIRNVKEAIQALTTGVSGSGYLYLNPNQDLYDTLPQSVLRLQTEVSLPHYTEDCNAHTDDELRFSAAMLMAEAQDKYLTLNYSVKGFSQNGNVWYPNQLCQVYDECTGADTPLAGPFWIRKVNFLCDRAGSFRTSLQLTLPYVHEFLITKD